MNHKRGRPKNSRSGCLLCKPHKANGVNVERPSIQRRVQVGKLERGHDFSRIVETG